MPIRHTESDKAIVVEKPVWVAMCALSARFHAPVQDVLPVYHALEFAKALTKGLEWLGRHLPADGVAKSREERFALSLSALIEPAVLKKVRSVIAMCEQGRGLHFANQIGW